MGQFTWVSKEIQNVYLIKFLDFVVLFHRDATTCVELRGGRGTVGSSVRHRHQAPGDRWGAGASNSWGTGADDEQELV
jgi:hypothetical protein